MQVQAAEDKFAYAFSRRPDLTPDIYVVDGEGGEPIQLTDDSGVGTNGPHGLQMVVNFLAFLSESKTRCNGC